MDFFPRMLYNEVIYGMKKAAGEALPMLAEKYMEILP